MSGRKPGIYRVKLGQRWTVGEYVVPDDDFDAYWIVLGSDEGFTDREFAKIGKPVKMPPNSVMEV
jgi:hypothetical protein